MGLKSPVYNVKPRCLVFYIVVSFIPLSLHTFLSTSYDSGPVLDPRDAKSS